MDKNQWKCVDGAYIHPNFTKLEKIFENYEELFQYLFKGLRKVANVNYQPQLLHLIDMLNVNSYYSEK